MTAPEKAPACAKCGHAMHEGQTCEAVFGPEWFWLELCRCGDYRRDHRGNEGDGRCSLCGTVDPLDDCEAFDGTGKREWNANPTNPCDSPAPPPPAEGEAGKVLTVLTEYERKACEAVMRDETSIYVRADLVLASIREERALRAEVERLTKERDYSVKALADRVARVAALMRIIEEAPHAENCPRWGGIDYGRRPCDCWKSKAELHK